MKASQGFNIIFFKKKLRYYYLDTSIQKQCLCEQRQNETSSCESESHISSIKRSLFF